MNRQLKINALLLLVSTIIALQLKSQQYLLSGKVITKDSLPVANASILLRRIPDSSFYRGAVSLPDGSFAFGNIRNDRYFLVISSLGYRNRTIAIPRFDTTSALNIGPQVLFRESESLSAVTVTAQKSSFEQRPDKVVVNMKDNIVGGGASVLDVLQKMPGVTINKQAATITLNGRSGATITINGEATYMTTDEVIQLLSGVSSNNVKEIELISVPRANFDAEGGGGVINIVLNRGKTLGSDFNVNIYGGYGRRGKTGTDLNYDFRRKKIQLSAAWSGMRDASKETWTNDRQSGFGANSTEISTTSHREPVTLSNNLRIGVDYFKSKRLSIGGFISGYQRIWKMNATNDINDIGNRYHFTLYDKEYYKLTSITTNLYARYQVTASSELTINTNFIYHKNIDNHQYVLPGSNPAAADSLFIFKTTPLKVYVIMADYNGKLAKAGTYGLGVKKSVSSFNNTVNVDSIINGASVANQGLSSSNSLNENTNAVYTWFQSSAAKKTSVYAGLRYEQSDARITDATGRNISNNRYGYLFPGIIITRSITGNTSVDISYNRRITRPSFNDLAPYVLLLDPFTYYSGNDSLKPTLTDAIKLDFRYKKYYLAIQYAVDKNAIVGFQPTLNPQTGEEILSAQNFNARKTFNVIVTIPFAIGPRFSSRNYITYTWQNINSFYVTDPVHLSLNNLRINSTNTFLLPAKYTIELSGYYQSPFLSGIVKQKIPGELDIGVQKEFKNKSKIRLSLDDVFKTNNWYLAGYQYFNNLKTVETLNLETRVFRISYSIPFGNSAIKNTKRITGSEDEQSRIN